MPAEEPQVDPRDPDPVAPRDPGVAELVQRERQEEQGHGDDGHEVAGRLAVLVVVGRREPDDEDQRDDEPARARADADPEDPSELDRPCSHSHTWWQANSRSRADRRPTGYASTVPPPHAPTRERTPVGQARPLLRRDPRAHRRHHRGNLVNVAALKSAHERVTTGVVPRIIAAQHADAAFADTHFSQTQMVLANGALRADEEADLRVFRRTPGRAARHGRRSAPDRRDRRRRQAVRGRDAKLYAAVKRGDPRRRRPSWSRATSTSRRRQRDHRHRHVHRPPANRERAPGRQALRRAEAGARRTTHDHRRAGPAGGARPWPSRSPATSAGAWSPLSRAAEALAEGDVDHELTVKGRDEVGRTAAALASMVDTSAPWPAPPTASPPAT